MKIAVALVLIQFSSPTGQRIDLNPNGISSIREPIHSNKEHWGKGTHCVIVMGNGRIYAVSEDCAMVRQKIGK